MITVGVVGAGRWGGNWLRTLARLPEVNLRWCCDVSLASLERVERQFPRISTTTRLEDLLQDGTLQAVVIASSAATHHDIARRCLLAGKHVLVEKPMTLTTNQAIALTELAESEERVLMVGHLLEYHPIIRQIQQMIQAGELGELLYVYSQRLNLGTIRSDENAWWSLAPHDISVSLRLLGSQPRTIQCRGQSIVHNNIPDVVFATLEFPGGRLAHFHVSWLDPHKSRRWTVVGAHKSVVFDDSAENKLVVYEKGFQRTRGADGPEVITLRQGNVIMPPHDVTEPLVAEAQHFAECIVTGKRPLTDGVAGTTVVSVLEYGQRSLDDGGTLVAIPQDALQKGLPLRRSA